MKRKPRAMKTVTDPYAMDEKVSRKHGRQTHVQKGHLTRNNINKSYGRVTR